MSLNDFKKLQKAHIRVFAAFSELFLANSPMHILYIELKFSKEASIAGIKRSITDV
jgi:hypothetical protein